MVISSMDDWFVISVYNRYTVNVMHNMMFRPEM